MPYRSTVISFVRRLRRPIWLGLLTVLLPCLLPAQSVGGASGPTAARSTMERDDIRPDHIWTGAYAKLVWDDTVSMATAPVRWDGDDWLRVGGAVAAVAVTVPFDRSIRKSVQARRTVRADRFFSQWQNLGNNYSFVVLGGFELWGEMGENTNAKNVAMDGLAASIIASGLIVPTLKFTVGRDRPSSNQGTYKFSPFTSNISFPSGHAAQAFAVATVIANHYPQPWVGALAYTSAALVGYARIEQDAHFASDVVAGAIIGVAVARSVVHRHDGPRDPDKLSWSPYGSGNGGGLVFFKSF
jgi:hypothetical protein